MNKIFILDEALDSSEKLKTLLEKDGHAVTVSDALRLPEACQLIIVHMSHQDFEPIHDLLEKLRKKNLTVPVLILVPSPTIPKIILTLERGASDIMNLPYHPKVLRAKVRALIRTVSRDYDSRLIHSGQITVDPVKFRVKVKDRDVRLTSALFKLLVLFLQNPERVFTRAELSPENSRTIDTQIVLLRKLLGPEGKRIKTIRGKGYTLQLPG